MVVQSLGLPILDPVMHSMRITDFGSGFALSKGLHSRRLNFGVLNSRGVHRGIQKLGQPISDLAVRVYTLSGYTLYV